MLISQVLFAPQSSPPRASRDAVSLSHQTSMLCPLSYRTPKPSKPARASAHRILQLHGKGWQGDGTEGRTVIARGSAGQPRNCTKALAKQLTPDIGEEITRTVSHLRSKNTQDTHTHHRPWFQELVHEMMQARAAGGRDESGPAEGMCPPEPPASPVSPIPSPPARACPCR